MAVGKLELGQASPLLKACKIPLEQLLLQLPLPDVREARLVSVLLLCVRRGYKQEMEIAQSPTFALGVH